MNSQQYPLNPTGIALRPLILLLCLTLILILLPGCAREKKITAKQMEPLKLESTQEAAPIPPTSRTMMALARILESKNKQGESALVVAQTIRQFPDFIPAYNKLAEMQIQQRRYEAAIQILEAGLAKAPQDPVLLNNLGMCHLLRSDFARAADNFVGAAAAQPQNARYRANLALALGMVGQMSAATCLYDQIFPRKKP